MVGIENVDGWGDWGLWDAKVGKFLLVVLLLGVCVLCVGMADGAEVLQVVEPPPEFECEKCVKMAWNVKLSSGYELCEVTGVEFCVPGETVVHNGEF